ncbi:hypothetical protein B0H13DRAFT_1922821 [Mycena leptocephala]|nr:hypothetical protein B0H13DRAFT_1922821 [Mycena leptocephala]
MNLALRDLCQGKVLGDAEMLLFYGFREPSTGELSTGMIHDHSVHNSVNFGGGREELELQYGLPWSEFAENAIPRPVIPNPLIPLNANNEPVSPSINVNNIAIGDKRMLLCDYFDLCWGNKYQYFNLLHCTESYKCVSSPPAFGQFGNSMGGTRSEPRKILRHNGILFQNHVGSTHLRGMTGGVNNGEQNGIRLGHHTPTQKEAQKVMNRSYEL